MSEREINPIPIGDIVSEDGAHELATSADMQPYLRPCDGVRLRRQRQS